MFAALTLPVASNQAHQVIDHWPTPVRQWVALSITNQQRGLSIRYIGFSILVSTALGIGTAEVLRSRQTYSRRQRELLRQVLSAHPNDPPTTADGMQSLASADTSPTHLPVAGSAREIDITVQPPPDKTETSADIPAIDWDALQSSPLPVAAADQSSQVAAVDLLPEGNYPTCQIRTPDHQRLTAICIDGEFFSFYRLIKDLSQARGLLEKLTQTGQKLIVTPEHNGFVLWSYQPKAELSTKSNLPPEPQVNRTMAQANPGSSQYRYIL
jgi:hypothetical protein